MAMSAHQQKVLAILSFLSGFISLLASTWIIVEVVTTRAKLHTVYNRLLLAMSIVDVMASIGYMFGPVPMSPEYNDEHDMAWAVGSDSACAAQGFLVQLGISSAACKYHNGNVFLRWHKFVAFDLTPVGERVSIWHLRLNE